MSVHIEDPGRTVALLIYGNWIDVDPGTLERYTPEHRSSTSTGVMYRWGHGDFTYMAMAADVKAVRLSQ